MSNKKYINNKMLRFQMQLKSIQYAFVWPILINWVVLPVLIWMIYQKYGVEEELYTWIIRLYQIFTPFFSVWCPLINAGEFIEGDGNELLYINRRIKAGIFFMFFVLCCLVLVVPFIGYTIMYDNMLLEYVRIVVECFFYCGGCYMLVCLLRSIPLTFMLILVYTLLATYSGKGGENIFIYFDTVPISVNILSTSYLPLMVIGLLFWFIGIIINVNVEYILSA